MARQLLGIADSGQSEAVRLAAIKDALDRSGIQAKTAVSVEVSTKPFELVFDSIVAGPREQSRSGSAPEIETQPALAIEGEIDAEIIDPDDGDPSFGLDAVEIEDADVIEAVDAGHTDAIMSDGSGPPHTGQPRFVALR